MTTAEETIGRVVSSSCDLAARGNFAASAKALAEACPWVQAVAFPPGEVVAARDGALSLRSEGSWAGGCSVPRVAARRMLASAQASGPVACLLEPTHAQTIVETLERIGPDRAVIALVAEEALAGICACADLSGALAAHRLFVVTEAEQMSALYRMHPGLSLPSFFIRLSFSDEARAARLIKEVQAALSVIIDEQKAEGVRLRSAATPAAKGKLCVLGASRFRLWGDGGRILAEAAKAEAVLDTDDPTTGTTHAILRAVQGCRAVVSADLWRHILRDLLPMDMPWHVWLTTANDAADVPPFALAGPHDLLWVVNEMWQRAAAGAGWPVARTRVVAPSAVGQACDPAGPFVLIGDTSPLTTPPDIEEYSSLRLLWEAIRDELLHDPQRLGGCARAYLETRRNRLGLKAEQLDTRRFIGQVVVAAYQQGLARQLCDRGLPLAVWGLGWDLPEVRRFLEMPAGVFRGGIEDREGLAAAVAAGRAVVDWRVSDGPALMAASGVRLLRPVEILQGLRPAVSVVSPAVGLVEALKEIWTCPRTVDSGHRPG